MILLQGRRSPLRLLSILALASASHLGGESGGGLRKTAKDYTSNEITQGEKPTADTSVNDRLFVDPHKGLELDDGHYIPVPVGKHSESHVQGRLLFNIDNEDARHLSRGHEVHRNAQETYESDVDADIVGGYEAPHAQPWFALALDKSGDSYLRGPCGATLISRKWAVTAAHCLSNSRENDLLNRMDYLYVGAYAPWDGNGGYPFEVIKIKTHIEHEGHEPGAGEDHDIALLELEEPVSDDFSGFYPMKVPTPGDEAVLNTDDVAIVYGLGDTVYGGKNSHILRQAEVGYVEHNQCAQDMWRWGITYDMICFGGNGVTDACSGDSGGPVIANDKLFGVVSWGYKCAAKGYPGVYASVEDHLDWIISKVGNETLTY